MRLVSLQVGQPQTIPETGSSEWWDKSWTSAFYKAPVSGDVWLGYEGLDGDGQADRRYHGGVDKAVCTYSEEHYPYWRETLHLADFPYGAFGENFTVTGLTETEVFLGDVYSVGEALVEISQPRQPCWKPARHWRIKDLTAQIEHTGKTGFYFRVMRHGNVRAGQEFILVSRHWPQWSIARCNEVMYDLREDADAALSLSDCPALAGSWKDALFARYRSLADRTAS